MEHNDIQHPDDLGKESTTDKGSHEVHRLPHKLGASVGFGSYADFEDIQNDDNNEHTYEQEVGGQWPVIFHLSNTVMRYGDNDEAGMSR